MFSSNKRKSNTVALDKLAHEIINNFYNLNIALDLFNRDLNEKSKSYLLQFIISKSPQDEQRIKFLFAIHNAKLISNDTFTQFFMDCLGGKFEVPIFYTIKAAFVTGKYDIVIEQLDKQILINSNLSFEYLDMVLSGKLSQSHLIKHKSGFPFGNITSTVAKATPDQLTNFWLQRLCQGTYIGSIKQTHVSFFKTVVCDFNYIAGKVEEALPGLKGKLSIATKIALREDSVLEKIKATNKFKNLEKYLEEQLADELKDEYEFIMADLAQLPVQERFNKSTEAFKKFINYHESRIGDVVKIIYKSNDPDIINLCFYYCIQLLKDKKINTHEFRVSCLLPFEDISSNWTGAQREMALPLLMLSYQQLGDVPEAQGIASEIQNVHIFIVEDVKQAISALKEAPVSKVDDMLQLRKIMERFIHAAESDKHIDQYLTINISLFKSLAANNAAANLQTLLGFSETKRFVLFFVLELLNKGIINGDALKSALEGFDFVARAKDTDGKHYANVIALYILILIAVAEFDKANAIFQKHFLEILKSAEPLDPIAEQLFYEYFAFEGSDKRLIKNDDYKKLLFDAKFSDKNLQLNLLLQAILKGSYLYVLLVSNHLASAHGTAGFVYVATETRIRDRLEDMLTDIKLSPQTVRALLKSDNLDELYKRNKLRAALSKALIEFIATSKDSLLNREIKIKLLKLSEGEQSINYKHELCIQALALYRKNDIEAAQEACVMLLQNKLDIPRELEEAFFDMLINGKLKPVGGEEISSDVLIYNFITYPKNPIVRNNLILQAICRHSTFVGSLTKPTIGMMAPLNMQYKIFANVALRPDMLFDVGINEVTKEALRKEVLDAKEFLDDYPELVTKVKILLGLKVEEETPNDRIMKMGGNDSL